jgi:hypothetical protein
VADQPAVVELSALANQEAGPGAVRERLEPLQQVGFYLASFLLAAIVLASVGIAWIAFSYTTAAVPPIPPATQSADTIAQYRDLVTVYKTLGDAPLERAKELFQLVVITALLPSFTAVLGYIFGTRTATK